MFYLFARFRQNVFLDVSELLHLSLKRIRRGGWCSIDIWGEKNFTTYAKRSLDLNL